VQGIMTRAKRKRAPTPTYVSPNQLTLDAFASPFASRLKSTNRWVVLGDLIPWDEICGTYLKHVGISRTGRPPLSPRVVIGSLIIKHMMNLDDREVVDQISENIYMQYFLGYRSFSIEPPFDPSLFVEFRKKLGADQINAINEKIISLKTHLEMPKNEPKSGDSNDVDQNSADNENRGRVIYDATACPQDIAYPTDLNLLSDAREKSEQLIDILFDSVIHKKKPRTYREVARKTYLHTAQKKNKSRKEIRTAVGRQLRFLKRNLKSINKLLNSFSSVNIPLEKRDFKYLLVINFLYQQQKEMYDEHKHTIEDRIVSIHQPHVRPIVRGKTTAKVEFGAKIHVSIIDGISFLDEISWDAFNEGSHMVEYVEKYKVRFGCYPRELLADKIYCTRFNRAWLKEKGIKLIAKPLGRPSAVQNHVSPGERNPIEGKFGQAKTAYGLNRIKARLRNTSESWIASIILVLNLVKLAGAALPCALLKWWNSFSAQGVKMDIKQIAEEIIQVWYLSAGSLNLATVSGKI
jgi:IS5 family transposase